ncbi:hypothetical protein C8J56DRAFT_1020645 [Mycena floridula]|nr:hypothetical protein C8J56DRAFT_1020645 [Mycena floridula]
MSDHHELQSASRLSSCLDLALDEILNLVSGMIQPFIIELSHSQALGVTNKGLYIVTPSPRAPDHNCHKKTRCFCPFMSQALSLGQELLGSLGKFWHPGLFWRLAQADCNLSAGWNGSYGHQYGPSASAPRSALLSCTMIEKSSGQPYVSAPGLVCTLNLDWGPQPGSGSGYGYHTMNPQFSRNYKLRGRAESLPSSLSQTKGQPGFDLSHQISSSSMAATSSPARATVQLRLHFYDAEDDNRTYQPFRSNSEKAADVLAFMDQIPNFSLCLFCETVFKPDEPATKHSRSIFEADGGPLF